MDISFFTTHEILIRLSAFLGIFAVMALWETLAPCRQLSVNKPQRWFANILLVILNTIILRLIFPLAATGIAAWTASRGWGLFNSIDLPILLEVILAVIILDCAIYWQHVLFHYAPIFWRFHKVHHADLDIDITTGSRFHPVEIILSLLIKALVIFLLGPAVVAVIAFEVILNGSAMFNHSNVRIRQRLDKALRYFIVTPDMHRVHHSVVRTETNSNFGFCLSWWDKIFRTYIQAPAAGNQRMEIGLSEYRESRVTNRLKGMLLIPFVGER